jgi:hypothetical protein
MEALKRQKDVPSPDRYQIPSTKDKTGGGLGKRFNTDYEEKYQKSIPGPGRYELKATEIANGNYFLSTFKYP